MGVVMTRNVMMKAEVVMQGMINSAPKMVGNTYLFGQSPVPVEQSTLCIR